MIKQLEINGLKSYDNFGLFISSRKISQPKKKTIKETIPFSNVVYDFSKMNGEIYWEERTLEYSFDIAEFTTEEMEEVKSKLLDWLLNVHDTDIYDPYIGDYHFHGSFDSDSWEEDFGGGILSVSFNVYPYKISNHDTIQTINGTKSLTIYNNSSHRIAPTITCDGEFTITYNNASFTIGGGTYQGNFYLEVGNNKLDIVGNGELKFTYKEERF